MQATEAPIDLSKTNEELKRMAAPDRILWAAERFGQQAVLLSSMQKTASVLMHTFFRLGLDNEIIFGDTGYHFVETLKLRDEFMRRYKLNIVTVYPELTPEEQEKKYERKLYLFIDGQKECCRQRKEEPFLAHMRANGKKLVMIGSRAVDGDRRARLDILSRDPRIGGYALHPIADWTDEQVAEYLSIHNVPVHPLHDCDYPSIGCQCCTTPVQPGEDARAGRWRHLREPGAEGPRYCGLNFTDGSGI